MAFDGIQFGNRVDNFGERKLYMKVVDNVNSASTYAARAFGKAQDMAGKTFDYPVKISDAASGEWIVGLESLNSAAEDDTITLSYAHTAFTQPVVSIMLESFANVGPEGEINLDEYKLAAAQTSAISKIGSDIYGTGSANRMLGLGAIVDDGTTVGSIGGQSRTTYTNLKATVTSSTGTLTLAKLDTLHDAVRASGLENEEPNVHLTSKTIQSFYGQLLQPSMRNNYEFLDLRGADSEQKTKSMGRAGFTAYIYRGRPVIADDKSGTAASGKWQMLNENYFEVRGRSKVPTKYKDRVESIDFGNGPIEGVGTSEMPSSKGWFFSPYLMLPNQAGMLARLFWIGQMCTSQPRRNGALTLITGV